MSQTFQSAHATTGLHAAEYRVHTLPGWPAAWKSGYRRLGSCATNCATTKDP